MKIGFIIGEIPPPIFINNLIDVKDDGTFRLDQNYFNYSTGLAMTNKKFHNLFGHKPRNPKNEKLTQFSYLILNLELLNFLKNFYFYL